MIRNRTLSILLILLGLSEMRCSFTRSDSSDQLGGGNLQIKLVGAPSASSRLFNQLKHGLLGSPNPGTFSVSTYAAPSSINDFGCFVVNITGAGLAAGSSDMQNCTFTNNMRGRGPGLITPMTNANSSARVKVIRGPQRAFDVYGIYPSAHLSNCGGIGNPADYAGGGGIYFLGSVVMDIGEGDQTVQVPVNFQAGSAPVGRCGGSIGTPSLNPTSVSISASSSIVKASYVQSVISATMSPPSVIPSPLPVTGSLATSTGSPGSAGAPKSVTNGGTAVSGTGATITSWSNFSIPITVSIAASAAATTACNVLAPFSSISCNTSSFNVTQANVSSDSPLMISAYSSNNDYPDVPIVSNSIGVNLYKFKQLSDISGNTNYSDLHGKPVFLNNVMYFWGTAGAIGQKLFKFDGSSISQLSETNPGASDMPTFPKNEMIVFNNEVYFSAKNSGGNTKLYRTDGSTVRLLTNTTSNTGIPDDPNSLTIYNSKLYFFAHDGNGLKTYVTDGTSVRQLINLNPGTNDWPRAMTVFNGDLYLVMRSPSNYDKLYKYNSTSDQYQIVCYTSGSATLNDLPSSGGSPPDWVATSANLVFTGLDASSRAKLFKTNGSSCTQITDIATGNSDISGSVFKMRPTLFNGKIYMVGQKNGLGKKLYEEGTSTVTQITKTNGTNDNNEDEPKDMTEFNSRLYFTANIGTGSTNRKLFYWDGTNVVLAVETYSGGNDDPNILGIVNSELYFSAKTSTSTRKLYKTDGSSVIQLTNIQSANLDLPDTGMGVDPAIFTLNGNLYVTLNAIGTTGPMAQKIYRLCKSTDTGC